jgi:hypothetical protein
MDRFIVFNGKDETGITYSTFREAEVALINFCKENTDLIQYSFIGCLTHKITIVSKHHELAPINQASTKEGYLPQEGDLFRKMRGYRVKSTGDLVFERRVVKVGPDFVVLQNGDNEKDLQTMPQYQFFRWIRGAEFVERAGKLL